MHNQRVYRLAVPLVMVGVSVCMTACSRAIFPPADARDGVKDISASLMLPNGQQFKLWESTERPKYRKTYHVDNRHLAASDHNPGTQDKPFKTIGRAAELAQPGDRVLVHPGIYRERVAPPRGGIGLDRMITYEGVVDAGYNRPVVRGSRRITRPWVTKLAGYGTDRYKGKVVSNSKRIWLNELPDSFFDDYNPTKDQNITAERFEKMGWAKVLTDQLPYTLPPMLVFQDGSRMVQVNDYDDLRRHNGTFWIEHGREGPILLIHPYYDQDPNKETIEVTTQKHLFAPASHDVNYIRVSGFVFEHCADPMPWPPIGAVSPNGGHHWIIENNIVRQVNGVGVNIGMIGPDRPKLDDPHNHSIIVRNNHISDCGMGGIEGATARDVLITGNRIERIGFYDVGRSFVTGGMKITHLKDSLVCHNLVATTIGSPGIWMDYGIVNTRVTRNVVTNVDYSTGAIFMEASLKPNTVDHNIVWRTNGPGIYQHDCNNLLVAHNLVGQTEGPAVLMRRSRNRIVLGKPSSCDNNKVFNNLFCQTNGQVSFQFPQTNVEKNNVDMAEGGAITDRRVQYMWLGGDVKKVSALDGFDRDYWGRLRPPGDVYPGPFVEIPKRIRLFYMPWDRVPIAHERDISDYSF